jgi:hypothetical protein
MPRLDGRCAANDSVCNVVQNDDLAKSLNTLRTVPGAPNPFAVSQRERIANQSTSSPAAPRTEQSSSR